MRLLALLCGIVMLFGSSLAALAEEFTFEQMLLAPVRVHLLTSGDENSPLRTKLTRDDVERVLRKANKVWNQAGIGFWLESVQTEPLETEEPTPDELPGDAGWLPRHVAVGKQLKAGYNLYYLNRFGVNGIYYPRGIFVKDTARLRTVEGGLDEPLPRVTAHELGHALGLPHRQDTFNLMASGTSAWALNAEEIARARQTAEQSGRFIKGPELLKRVESAGTERAGSTILSLEKESFSQLKAALAKLAAAQVAPATPLPRAVTPTSRP